MAQKIGDAFVEISARLDKFMKQIDGASKKVQTSFQKVNNKLSSAFKGLGGVIAGAFAVEKIAAFTLEAVKLASVAEGVKKAFDRLNDQKLLDNLKRATRGTVSELELMKSAVQAENLGVPVENLANLFEFATQRAADTGLAVDYLVESLVGGIGKKSTQVLDNLGITATALRNELGGISLEMASVGEVAEAVGNIGVRSLGDIGDQALTSAQKIAQMQANLSDAQTEFGKNAMPLFLAGLKGINVALENINEVFGSDKSFFERLKGLASQINPIMLAMKLFGEEAQTAADKVKETDQNVKNLTESLKESEGYFDFIGGGWVDAVSKSESSIGSLEKQIKDLETTSKETTNLEEYLAIMEKIAATQDKINKITERPKESTPEIAQKGIPQVGSVGGLGPGATLSTTTAEGISELTEKTKELSEAQQFGSGIAMDFWFCLARLFTRCFRRQRKISLNLCLTTSCSWL